MVNRLTRQRSAVTAVAAVGVAASVAVTGLVGCSSGSAVDRNESVGRPSAEAAHVHEHQKQAPAAAELTADELRAQLEQLLGQHAFLAVRLTRSRLRGDEDLAQSADAALSKNTADLGELIGSVYGADAAEQFEQLWFRHVTYLFNYARGVADNDPAVKSEARRQLDEYTTALSTFVETATKKAVPASVLATMLQMHVHQLLKQVDAYAAEDYERAFAVARESYAHMFPLGKALAAGIVTGEGTALPADFDSPERELQSQLGMLLGEHAELAVDAMRSGFSKFADFPAAAAALDQNTRELTGMIESVFGAASARSFQTLWSAHIDDFVTYTQALATDDAALEATARERLERFNAHFATFLSTSKQGRLATPALADAFVMHEDLLFKQINAYAEQDYSTAHQVAYDAYKHMFAVAAQAATAIGETMMAKSPKGGAETGVGGMAASHTGR
jgi:hypothetical protein